MCVFCFYLFGRVEMVSCCCCCLLVVVVETHDSVGFFEEFVRGGDGFFLAYFRMASPPEEFVECWG